jgi:hypothetical protein
MSGFNAIDTTRRLEGLGFTRQQSEGLAQLFDDLWGSVVTRVVLREELERAGRDLEQRMTIRLGGMLVVAVGATSAIVHFWK